MKPHIAVVTCMLLVAAACSSETADPLVPAEAEPTGTALPTTQPTEASTPAPSPSPQRPRPVPAASATPPPPTTSRGNCDPSYPTVCIAPPPPDLDCGDIPYRRFPVTGADPHRFDGDHNGVGCES